MTTPEESLAIVANLLRETRPNGHDGIGSPTIEIRLYKHTARRAAKEIERLQSTQDIGRDCGVSGN